ncbi:aminoacyl-histidine dipeptidase [Endozoicomonas sp. 8E]|uniref:aminoacyl-histidine dipeptidase n=1 Tax=Endozoicomonas sp. 8E TaxID=3035692 RepID=UPI0029394ED0|nr:aminoacyl-histidine dipeptidase [Endozoicomonas sp. 8E]WOG25404.1 aminoacyl-histidine dipeptidase [Endozoicomonas sp. 8E]
MTQLVELSHQPIWRHFQALCKIPRPSKHEDAVRAYVKEFGENLGLDTLVDEVGNVIIRKPATQGMENCRGVVLQSHLDMVPQKNADTEHDFTKDPIRAYVDGDWVTAEGTTLGADNGIGVAAAMAVFESTDIPHGPVEALFTIDEESGMSGAHGLKPGLLNGEIMLNMDSEDEGELYVGCAGGVDISVSHSYQEESLEEGYSSFSLALKGLKGGHSGVDIKLQRGNANKLMVRLLKALTGIGARLAEYSGGSLRNAIPREAFAQVAIPSCNREEAARIVDEYLNVFRTELAEVEPDLSLVIQASESVQKAMPLEAQSQLLDTLHVSPNGVHRMSLSVEGVVETSNNLAVIKIKEGRITIENMVRSLIDSAREEHAESIAGLYRLMGAEVKKQGAYPGWKPNTESTILKTMKDIHEQLFGYEPEIKVIHAGLECGLLGSAYPNWDMISFGPTIRFPHSPDEKVHIPAVENFWNYLIKTLEAIPEA